MTDVGRLLSLLPLAVVCAFTVAARSTAGAPMPQEPPPAVAEDQYAMGRRYYYGEGVARDYEQAVACFSRAAAEGSAAAMWALADCYLLGRGVAMSHNEAIAWGQQALAHEQRELPTAGIEGYINGHEFVDLGLSVKWATVNVGASTAMLYERFDYFAYGETKTKYEYTEDNSRTYGVEITHSVERLPYYDAAQANWGGTWRLPTKDEIDELIDRCLWQWDRRYFIGGFMVEGYTVTGPNGSSIFLPAAGRLYSKTIYDWGVGGGYLCATPAEDDKFAYTLRFTKDNRECIASLRAAGWAVRAVTD